MSTVINTALVRAMIAINSVKTRLVEERGQDLLEYALLGGLLAAAITAVGVIAVMTGAVDGMAEGIGDCIDFDNVTPCGPF